MNADIDRIEAYLGALPADQQTLLRHVRATIAAAAPEAVESFGYGIPGFKLEGALLSYGAAKAHCAVYGQSPATQERLAERLQDFDTAKGTIRFTPAHPLPDDVLTEFVRLRVAENLARADARRAKRRNTGAGQ
jgi:uncharacterized protein YdhG (YjbR/CyaY superfamily)